jgi:hypothetical protein
MRQFSVPPASFPTLRERYDSVKPALFSKIKDGGNATCRHPLALSQQFENNVR